MCKNRAQSVLDLLEMWEYSSLFLCLSTVTHVFGLSCNAVPFGTRAQDVRDVLINCSGEKASPLDSPSSCYKIVHTERLGRIQYIAKGCMPNNGCEKISTICKVALNVIINKADEFDPVIKCYECTGDACNSAPTFDTLALLIVFLMSNILIIYKYK